MVVFANGTILRNSARRMARRWGGVDVKRLGRVSVVIMAGLPWVVVIGGEVESRVRLGGGAAIQSCTSSHVHGQKDMKLA